MRLTLAAAVALVALLPPACASPPPCLMEPGVAFDAATGGAVTGTALKVNVSASEGCVFDGGQLSLALKTGGGGRVEPAVVALGSPGDTATVTWTLGPAPIRNTLTAVDGRLEVVPALAATVTPTAFVDVDAWMSATGLTGSTEDLAIRADGTIMLGIPGGLITVTPGAGGAADIAQVKLSGDPVKRALGIAYDRKGTLWVADPEAPALHAVDPAGVVVTHLAPSAERPLLAPNYVAVWPADEVVLSDPCQGALLRYDPKVGAVTAHHGFDLLTEGGPNGFAWDAKGTRLYVVTENTALLCPMAKVKPAATAPIAGLFRIDTSGAGFGARVAVQTGIGLFGDGMALDAEGNLYVVVDTAAGLSLQASKVMVLRAGESSLAPFVACAKDTVIANVAFGRARSARPRCTRRCSPSRPSRRRTSAAWSASRWASRATPCCPDLLLPGFSERRADCLVPRRAPSLSQRRYPGRRAQVPEDRCAAGWDTRRWSIPATVPGSPAWNGQHAISRGESKHHPLLGVGIATPSPAASRFSLS